MAKPVTIVVLAKYPEIFTKFHETVELCAPAYDKILVRDGKQISTPKSYRWKTIQGPEKFSMGGNGNLGLKAVDAESDILYCGDDIRFTSPETVEILQNTAYSDPKIGIVSPVLIGRGSPSLTAPPSGISDVVPGEFWFPCVYIKRELIEKIGYLDESFAAFGCDDLDYCIRTLQAGYRLVVTTAVSVQHEASPAGGPTTFAKSLGEDQWAIDQAVSQKKIVEKYKVSIQAFKQMVETGNLDYLITPKSAPSVVPPEQAMEYLKTRSVYIATPAYGGWMSVNYVNSLLSLINTCHDLGIKHTVSFKYNESLITRARNSMVHDFLTKSTFTDFYFIDADIGFDPKDLIAMLLRPEEVIGSPCVRKSFNWTRIQAAIKASPTPLTEEQLSTLGGEFVINFPPDNQPASINLGEMLEVQDVGTGIMRVKREVFTKLKEFFPENQYLPMGGDGSFEPHHMFFQSRIDQDSAKYTPGNIPMYIPEDFAFCRDVRKAGMKIFMAPWMKTTHFGSHCFLGDMVAVAKSGGQLR